MPLNITLKNTYTIVINAGHGGADKGGVGVDGKSTEAALTLELANTIKSLNQNNRLNLVFTRSADESQSVAEIATIANKANPDLFVSLHYNSSKNNQLSGTEIYIANPIKTNSYNSHLQFANQLANDLDDLKIPFKGIKSKQEGVYVLQNVNCPSVLVEAGYLSNQVDLEKIKSPQFREQLAVALLNGIQKYILAKESGKLVNPEPLYLLDGKIVDKSVFNSINPNSIKSVEVLKANKALEAFGDQGKNGVIKVTLKSPNDKMLEGGQVFSAVQEEPKFNGGKEAWIAFLNKNLKKEIPIEKGGPPGKYTVVLSFIIDTKGKVSNVEAENDPGYGTAEEAVRVMKLSPNWIPAKQNGKPVVYKHKHTITYMISED